MINFGHNQSKDTYIGQLVEIIHLFNCQMSIMKLIIAAIFKVSLCHDYDMLNNPYLRILKNRIIHKIILNNSL
jgi:hypothetical protein